MCVQLTNFRYFRTSILKGLAAYEIVNSVDGVNTNSNGNEKLNDYHSQIAGNKKPPLGRFKIS